MCERGRRCVCFFFNDTATTEIYTLSHTTLFRSGSNFNTLLAVYVGSGLGSLTSVASNDDDPSGGLTDRKSTRLNSSHANISYAVFCLKKKHLPTLFLLLRYLLPSTLTPHFHFLP